jgi:hypothetical protein
MVAVAACIAWFAVPCRGASATEKTSARTPEMDSRLVSHPTLHASQGRHGVGVGVSMGVAMS